MCKSPELPQVIVFNNHASAIHKRHWHFYIVMDYYDITKACYKDKYRRSGASGKSITDVLKCSGFTSYPEEEYSTILATIKYFSERFDSVYDMGCGSGLLLNYIETHIEYPITLYGVDFVEDSILLANSSFPKYHFFCENVVFFRLSTKTSDKCLILIDPYHYRAPDLELLIQYYLQLNAKIIAYTYSDVLAGLSYKTIFDFELFKKHQASFSIIKESINTSVIIC